MGLRPGVEIEVREKHPFDGPLVLQVVDAAGQHRVCTLGDKVARQILVRRIPTALAEGSVDPLLEGGKEQSA
jgi:Fe2+ transport system protein FeoA